MSDSSPKRLRNEKVIVPNNPSCLFNHTYKMENSNNKEILQGQGSAPSPSNNQQTQGENEERQNPK